MARIGAAFALFVVGVAALLVAAGLTVANANDPGPPAAWPSPLTTPDAPRVDARPKTVLTGSGADPMTEAGQHQLASARFGRRHTPSPLVIPDQDIPLRFAHDKHMALGMKCVDCHSTIPNSVRASDVNLPKEAVCLDCHFVEDALDGGDADPPAACNTCHPGFEPTWPEGADRSDTSTVLVHPAKVVFPAPNLKFNHKVHVEKGVDCLACHADVPNVGLATRDNALPLMATCIDCHDGQAAPDECRTCHLTRPDGRIDTALEGGKLAPSGWYHDDAHDEDWLTSHRAAAQMGDGYCATCHTQKECIDCHNGVTKPLRIHPNNWILQHATAARKNVPDCQSCHQSQTFCVDCHSATKVVSDGPNRIDSSRFQFHPDGWVGERGRRTASHHSIEAQRNIRACASCHTEETCTACHASNGLDRNSPGYNPHPPGFVSSGDCDRMLSKNDRVCVKCHQPSSRALSCRR